MRSTSIIIILLLFISCGKETAKQKVIPQETNSVPPYDTIAIDSFSQGATSVDIARKIKISSLKYQDSLKQIKMKNEEEQLLKTAKEEKLNAEKKVAEAIKKTDLGKSKEKPQVTQETINP
ncbi:hypothetical protein [Chryseobacterium sp. MDT2-18]|uniref:hypothetical protein n=1 Tax=Chryseobacterium sp. MDT2-18 TaxID=1259136 RepID=UPI00277E5147|nr:hypothetical protein [Chryseobacterium sp. MDT2-18]MDQ0476808.1 hypothetical protein [Chryseobacterium sp. MDT2-18]